MASQLSPGALVGEGILFQGEPLRVVELSKFHRPTNHWLDLHNQPEPKVLEIVRVVGIGPYVTSYVAVLVLPPAYAQSASSSIAVEDRYGRLYNVQVFTKAPRGDNFASIMRQMAVMQSVPFHANVVNLSFILETSSTLIGVTDHTPGSMSLLRFLKEGRDLHEESTVVSVDDPFPCISDKPLSLSAFQFSLSRMQLISRMFVQMCDAITVFHEASVFHCDLTPGSVNVCEGRIITNGVPLVASGAVMISGSGLAIPSSDSGVPGTDVRYLSYERRNNLDVIPGRHNFAHVGDIWSLGVILINMLYHRAPWNDTADGQCPHFTEFRRAPMAYFLQNFPHMTSALATFLVQRIFCIIDNSTGDSTQRICARDLRDWAKDLPALIGEGYSTSPVLQHLPPPPGGMPTQTPMGSTSFPAHHLPVLHVDSISLELEDRDTIRPITGDVVDESHTQSPLTNSKPAEDLVAIPSPSYSSTLEAGIRSTSISSPNDAGTFARDTVVTESVDQPAVVILPAANTSRGNSMGRPRGRIHAPIDPVDIEARRAQARAVLQKRREAASRPFDGQGHNLNGMDSVPDPELEHLPVRPSAARDGSPNSQRTASSVQSIAKSILSQASVKSTKHFRQAPTAWVPFF
ncbi:hypothetical protein BV25DRAFT_340576 [Artomyces pyxidatus]|uniref:Uncharacterized protein n=1 Tax=Artomyces pyxidatus TaxID=48021 RepID=A0ACB8T6J8_9AGAM|nr:hypothetical protein BV25DRAFT_340576 [Artomyces pyxidatus]